LYGSTIHFHKAPYINLKNYGIEPIGRVLPIFPSIYYREKYLVNNPEKRSFRSQHDRFYLNEIRRIWQDSKSRYGVRKVCQQMKADGTCVTSCTLERLIRQHGLQGIWRSKGKITTNSCNNPKQADGLVNRNCDAYRPNQLWVADFTYIETTSG